MRNVTVNVFKSDAVIWWAAIFRTTSSMFDKLLHPSKSERFAMSCSRRHDLREAVGNLLTVTKYLQDTLSRFHRPGLHKVDLRVHLASASTRTLAFHKSPRAAGLSVHSTIVLGEHLHNLLHWSLIAIPSQAPPTSAISSDSPELTTNHVLLLGRRVHGIPRVFNRTFDPNCSSKIAATVFDVSSPMPASITTTTEPCGMPAIPGTSRLQPTIMLHAGFPIKYLSKR